MRCYLKDLPSNVTKDTDIVEWWQVSSYNTFLSSYTKRSKDNGHRYPTFRCVALDFLPCQVSSVVCERLFSAGGEIATKRRAQLGAEQFEELQIMKFAWKKIIDDHASWNLEQVEEVDDCLVEYKDFLSADRDQVAWDDSEEEIL